MNLKLVKVSEMEERERKQLDAFIDKKENNGEFINSPLYLSYHAPGRFRDDSVLAYDLDCGQIKGCLMAAEDLHNPDKIISHPGTTFAGPIINQRTSIHDRQSVLEILLNYYEKKYKMIELRTHPSIYSKQPDELMEFFLIRRGYQREIASMANVIKIGGIKIEDIFMLYKANKRNRLKKSIKEGLYDICAEQNVDIRAWSSLTKNLDSKFQISPTHSWNEIQTLKRIFPQRIQIYSVYRKTGEYGAFALVYCFKNVFHTQYLDLNYELSVEYPNLILVHHLIQRAVEGGYSYFSFGASTEPGGLYINQGLFVYKAEFGGGEIILPKFVKRQTS